MSKSKKKKEKENKEQKGFAIPPSPDFIFVVELEGKVLVTSEPITECVFPHYRFETTTAEGFHEAFKAAEDIANNKGCDVIDAVSFSSEDPDVYNPKKREAQHKAFWIGINAERVNIREAWLKIEGEKKKQAELDKPRIVPIVDG